MTEHLNVKIGDNQRRGLIQKGTENERKEERVTEREKGSVCFDIVTAGSTEAAQE